MKGRVVRCAVGVVAAVTLLGSASGDPRARDVPAARRVEGSTLSVYLGTYTRGASQGIYVLGFDPASGTWTSAPVLAGQSENPSFLALHPNGRFLYAVNEVADFKGARTGAVSAFAVDPTTGRLTLVNQQPSEGASPCHITVDTAGRHALVANYTGGTVAVLPIARDGGLGPASAVRRRSGSGPVRARQEGPHAHQIVLDASGRFAIWTDLGTDRVLVDRYAPGAGTLEPNDPDGVDIQPGSGPRHLAWHPAGRVLYLLSELSSTVSVLRFNAGRGALEVLQTVSARAAGARGQNSAAEIAVSHDGRFLYTSNRGDDDIAVFAIGANTVDLTPVAHVPAGGRTPRSFAIDPSGRWLVVANQGSSSIIVFRLDPATGVPAQAGPAVSVPDPVCVLFAPSAGAAAGNPAPQVPAPPTIFVDASVVDGSGRPVTTLRPADVRVTVDGELRSVVSLRLVHRGPGAETAAGLADPAREAPAAAEGMRSLLLLVDENSITPGQEKAVVGAAGRLLNELGAADQAAVVTLPRPPARINLTTEEAARQASLSRVTGRLLSNAPGDASQAAAPPAGRPPDVTVDVGAGDPEEQVRLEALARDPVRAGLRDEVEPATTPLEAGVRGTIRALLGVVDGLRGLPGLKTVVVLRQAAPVGGVPASAGGTPASTPDDRRTDVDATVSAAARARAVIHLVVVGTAGGRRGAFDDDLREVAEGTGGTITIAKDGGDTRAFDDLLTALSSGYLLEVEARSSDQTTRARPISVEVARPQTVVRAARRWVPRDDPVPRIAVSAPRPSAPPPTAASLPIAPPSGEPARRGAGDDPQLVLLLARVSEYLAAWVSRLSSVVAEEDYSQRILRGAMGKIASRHMRSDLVIVRTDADIGWFHYRDVFEVDGRPVRDRDQRVQRLFLDDPEGALRRGPEITQESARYNIGAMARTTNWPTLALAYLSPSRIGGLSVRLDGEDTVDGIRAAKLAFQETASPSLVRPINATGDIPARGTFWIDPANGRILKTRLSATAGTNAMTTTVVYKPMPNVGIWLPAEMDEWYGGQQEEIEAHAVYRNFRMFAVTTETKIK